MQISELSNIEFYRGQTFAITGPVHSEKTLDSILLNNRINIHTPYRSLMFTNDINSRDGKDRVASAAGLESGAKTVPASNPWKILDFIEQEQARETLDAHGKKGELHVIIFDECNFYSSDFIDVIDRIRLIYSKIILILTGLNYNFRREQFGIMGWANSNAKKIELESNCKVAKWGKPCGKLTQYTARFINFEKYKAPVKPVDLIDKYGNLLKQQFSFDMFFSPTIIVEETDDEKKKNEENKGRIYSVACLEHFQLPFEKETKDIHLFIREEYKKTQHPVKLETVKNEFKKTQPLDNILTFLTSERGVMFSEDSFSLRTFYKGVGEGHYTPAQLNNGIYMPGLEKEFV
ncbi:hypothetical protein HYV79_02280 [Candidatus Woesearchaeota archaeon]|nr:hypothetical protein [Candidatus Woesearchaeota archaeon]